MKLIRSLAASCTLLLASLLAHILAGGGVLILHSAFAISISSILISTLFMTGSNNPIRATLAIFLAQNMGHFILSGQVRNDSQMLFSHLFAGFVSYQLLRYFNRDLPSFNRVLVKLLPSRFITHSVDSSIFSPSGHFDYRSLATPYLSYTQSLRAPPSR